MQITIKLHKSRYWLCKQVLLIHKIVKSQILCWSWCLWSVDWDRSILNLLGRFRALRNTDATWISGHSSCPGDTNKSSVGLPGPNEFAGMRIGSALGWLRMKPASRWILSTICTVAVAPEYVRSSSRTRRASIGRSPNVVPTRALPNNPGRYQSTDLESFRSGVPFRTTPVSACRRRRNWSSSIVVSDDVIFDEAWISGNARKQWHASVAENGAINSAANCAIRAVQ